MPSDFVINLLLLNLHFILPHSFKRPIRHQLEKCVLSPQPVPHAVHFCQRMFHTILCSYPRTQASKYEIEKGIPIPIPLAACRMLNCRGAQSFQSWRLKESCLKVTRKLSLGRVFDRRLH